MNNYIPKNSLDEYIDGNELNTDIYSALLTLQNADTNRHSLKKDLLEIFNKMYEMCHIIRLQEHAEDCVFEYWNSVRAKYLVYETSIIFSGTYIILSIFPKSKYDLTPCLIRLKAKIEPAYFAIFESILSNGKTYTENNVLPANFLLLKAEADEIQDLAERELFYQRYLTRYQQTQNKGDIQKQIEFEIKLIERIRELSNTQPTETTEKNGTKRTQKVTTDVLLALLQQAGISAVSDDKAKMARLIAHLTDFSEEKIRQRLSNTEELTSYHREEVENINKILSELNSSISIKYNKQR